jgi:hypothetical protein
VRSASLSQIPLLGEGRYMTMVAVPGAKPKGSLIMNVGADFFSTMAIPILLGRGIDERDRADAAMTAVVNRTLAKEWFGDQNPVGRRLTVSDCPKCEIEVVGLCGDARYGRLKEQFPPTAYFSFAQWPVEGMTYEMRTAGNPLGASGARDPAPRRRADSDGRCAHATVADRRPDQPRDRLRAIVHRVRVAGAGDCVRGTIRHDVVQRGATNRRDRGAYRAGRATLDVAGMVLREAMLLVAAGVGLGVLVFLADARLAASLISDLLYGLKPNDVTSVMLATVTLVVVAACAGLLPARRASRIDPLTAIRYE